MIEGRTPGFSDGATRRRLREEAKAKKAKQQAAEELEAQAQANGNGDTTKPKEESDQGPTPGADTKPESKTTTQQPEQPTANPQQEEQDEYVDAKPRTNPFKDVAVNAAAMAAGTVTGPIGFATNLLSYVPGLQALDQAWDESQARHRENPWYATTQDVSEVLLPAVAIGLATRGTVRGLPLGNKTKLLAQGGMFAGTEALITAGTTDSEKDLNLAGLADKHWNMRMPWSNYDIDNPDIVQRRNWYEAMGITAAVEGGIYLFSNKSPWGKSIAKLLMKVDPTVKVDGKKIKLREAGDYNATKEGAAIGQSKSLGGKGQKLPDNDAARDQIDEIVEYNQTKKQVMAEKGAINKSKNPGEFDAYANNHMLSHETERPVMSLGGNPAMAMLGNFRMRWNLGTWAGNQPAATTDHMAERILTLKKGSELFKFQEKLANDAVDLLNGAQIGPQTFSKEELVDGATEQMGRMLNMDPAEYMKQQQEVIQNLDFGTRLSQRELAERMAAYKALLPLVAKANTSEAAMQQFRGMALMVNDQMSRIAAGSRAFVALEKNYDGKAQVELVLENMGALWTTLRATAATDGANLQMWKKLVAKSRQTKTMNKLQKEELAEQVSKDAKKINEDLETVLTNSQIRAKNTIEDLKRMNRENPRMLKPFMEFIDLASINNDVRLIDEFYSWIDSKSSYNIFYQSRKGQSLMIQALNKIMYNGALYGKAVLNSGIGNTLMMGARGATSLIGTAPELLRGDASTFKRNVYALMGFQQTLPRMVKRFSQTLKWTFSNSDIQSRFREEMLDVKYIDEKVRMEDVVAAWYENGEYAKAIKYKFALLLDQTADKPFMRGGVNTMVALDGASEAFSASMISRMDAYSQVVDQFPDLKIGSPEWTEAFNKIEKKLYQESFEGTGTGALRPGAAAVMNKQLTMSTKNEQIEGMINNLTSTIPVTRTSFAFPRTTVNTLKTIMSFTPGSHYHMLNSKVRRAMIAEGDKDKMAKVVIEHGFNPTNDASILRDYKYIRAEYIGRQMLGTALIAAMFVGATSNLSRGNGDYKMSTEQRFQRAGRNKLQVRKPGTNEWLDVRVGEPFTTLFGIVNDLVYIADDVNEDMWHDIVGKIGFVFAANITNKSFTAGVEPYIEFIGADDRFGAAKSAFNRLMADWVNSHIPFSGMRSIGSNLADPGVKDIEKDFLSLLASRNKGLHPFGDSLAKRIDFMDGEPVGEDYDWWQRAFNAVSPIFASRGGSEPERQFMLDIGYAPPTRLFEVDESTGMKIPKHVQEELYRRTFKGGWFKKELRRWMIKEEDGGYYWQRKLEEYARSRDAAGDLSDIKMTLLHNALDKSIADRVDRAMDSLQKEYGVQDLQLLKQRIKTATNKGEFDSVREMTRNHEEELRGLDRQLQQLR